MGVPAGVWIASAVIIVILSWMTYWITNKAYSRKWEESETEAALVNDYKSGEMIAARTNTDSSQRQDARQ